MITATKNELETYKGISPYIDMAIDFLLKVDADISCGRHVIDGDNVFANVIEGNTSDPQEPMFEAHKKYIDIHYILSGKEGMVYANVNDLTCTTEYDGENDVMFLKGDGTLMNFKQGSFYVMHPFDAHAVGIGDGSAYKKIIVKVICK